MQLSLHLELPLSPPSLPPSLPSFLPSFLFICAEMYHLLAEFDHSLIKFLNIFKIAIVSLCPLIPKFWFITDSASVVDFFCYFCITFSCSFLGRHYLLLPTENGAKRPAATGGDSVHPP